MHLDGDSDVLRKIIEMSRETLDPETFISMLGAVIEKSKDVNVCETKKCVEDAIVFTIIEDDTEEPRVAAYYEPLASTVIAKHLMTIYKSL
jgi:hypothetical protein